MEPAVDVVVGVRFINQVIVYNKKPDRAPNLIVVTALNAKAIWSICSQNPACAPRVPQKGIARHCAS